MSTVAGVARGASGGEGHRHRRSRPAPARSVGDFHVLRYVAGTSPLHRMWAGTKLLAMGALSIGVLLWPSWGSLGLFGVVLLLAILGARLPRGVVPRLPRSLFILLGVSALIALVAGGRPEIHLGRFVVGLGGLGHWARFTLLGVEVLAAAALVAWTTPLASLSPALGRLAGPLRRLHLPVDELVGATALSIRCLPLLLDEVRILRAARAARRIEGQRSLQSRSDDAVEMIFVALANAIRRARELAEAIEARGGVPTIAPETHQLGRPDLVAAVVVAAAVSGMGLFG